MIWLQRLQKKPKIAILGLNPHCESIETISEEKSEIIPAIRYLATKKIKIEGPFAADTFFLEKNIKNTQTQQTLMARLIKTYYRPTLMFCWLETESALKKANRLK